MMVIIIIKMFFFLGGGVGKLAILNLLSILAANIYTFGNQWWRTYLKITVHCQELFLFSHLKALFFWWLIFPYRLTLFSLVTPLPPLQWSKVIYNKHVTLKCNFLPSLFNTTKSETDPCAITPDSFPTGSLIFSPSLNVCDQSTA